MKKFSFNCLALCVLCGASMSLLVPGVASAGWILQNSGTTDHLYSVHFPVDALTGYAVGQSGTILKTANGGATWDTLTSGTTRWLWSVHFPVDASTGYVVGSFGTILKTTNGGANWVSQTSGTTANLYSVHFPVDALTGYAVGESGTILKTTNGGANWVSQTSGTTANLYSVHFPVDALTGYAVGGNGTILKTTDGGIGVEENRQGDKETRGQGESLRATPTPFTTFATLPGHEAERFSLYDVSGRKVGSFRGDRVGEGLAPGVYFLRPENGAAKPLRIVMVR